MGPLAPVRTLADAVSASQRSSRGARAARVRRSGARAGRVRRQQRLRRGAQEHPRTSRRRPTRAPKRRPPRRRPRPRRPRPKPTSTTGESSTAKPSGGEASKSEASEESASGGARAAPAAARPAAPRPKEKAASESAERRSGGRSEPHRRRQRTLAATRARPSGAQRAASWRRRGARAWRSASRCRSGARSGTGSSTGRRCRSAVCVVCALVLVHWLLRAAGAPGGVVAEAERERRRPRGHGQRDDVALLDRDRRFERELGGLAEVRFELDERALRDQLVGEVRFASAARRIAMPASEAPPSLALKNLIWVAFGLPSVIVQATIVPLRGALSEVVGGADLDLEAGRAADGQARGCRGSSARSRAWSRAITPTSVSVAGASRRAAPARARALARRASGYASHMCHSTRRTGWM